MSAPQQWPFTISVVIPARNEAARIADCLAALRGAPGVLEVIVVDDESSDATAQIAEQCGATVVRGAALPAEWVGKAWALQQGVAVAKGDVVVTLDADTRPSAQLPLAARDALLQSDAHLATVAPRFRCRSQLGRWLHAAMLTSLVYRHAAGARQARRDAVANGQCMVFRRHDALHDDWFTSVRSSTIEDVALVRCLVARGKQVEMFDGRDLLVVEMFESFGDTWRGWGRSLALSAVESRWRQVTGVLVTALTLVAPLLLVAVGGVTQSLFFTPFSATLLAIRIGTLIGTRRAYERGGLGYWLSPFADLLAWIVVVRGTMFPSRQWRGRTY
ncbi:MAG: glycosyltransferase [Acidimicrobiia bacterium]|nr:glycosyltransferase [Acidimicrobiia bacterium]